jgi:hypothetical protein
LYSNLLVNPDIRLAPPKPAYLKVFSESDVLNSIDQLKKGKALGPDYISVEYLQHHTISRQVASQLSVALNSLSVPTDIFESRMMLFSKTGKSRASMSDSRFICI